MQSVLNCKDKLYRRLYLQAEEKSEGGVVATSETIASLSSMNVDNTDIIVRICHIVLSCELAIVSAHMILQDWNWSRSL